MNNNTYTHANTNTLIFYGKYNVHFYKKITWIEEMEKRFSRRKQRNELEKKQIKFQKKN